MKIVQLAVNSPWIILTAVSYYDAKRVANSLRMQKLRKAYVLGTFFCIDPCSDRPVVRLEMRCSYLF
jgi:hypothetical protein